MPLRGRLAVKCVRRYFHRNLFHGGDFYCTARAINYQVKILVEWNSETVVSGLLKCEDDVYSVVTTDPIQTLPTFQIHE
jgi:hypothetical protein